MSIVFCGILQKHDSKQKPGYHNRTLNFQHLCVIPRLGGPASGPDVSDGMLLRGCLNGFGSAPARPHGSALISSSSETASPATLRTFVRYASMGVRRHHDAFRPFRVGAGSPFRVSPRGAGRDWKPILPYSGGTCNPLRDA